MLGRNGAPRPLRIALVTEYYYPHLGGVCEHVHFFAREARKYGHEVDIITSRIEGTAIASAKISASWSVRDVRTAARTQGSPTSRRRMSTSGATRAGPRDSPRVKANW